jgi:hypothetical protein
MWLSEEYKRQEVQSFLTGNIVSDQPSLILCVWVCYRGKEIVVSLWKVTAAMWVYFCEFAMVPQARKNGVLCNSSLFIYFSVGKVISTLGYKEIHIINRSAPSLWMGMVPQAGKKLQRQWENILQVQVLNLWPRGREKWLVIRYSKYTTKEYIYFYFLYIKLNFWKKVFVPDMAPEPKFDVLPEKYTRFDATCEDRREIQM